MTHTPAEKDHTPPKSGNMPPLPQPFVDAVRRVLNAPPTPAQQAKKDASKARQAERKTEQQPATKQDTPTQQ